MSLSEDQVTGIMNQLIDIIAQLHAYEWSHIGGLQMSDTGHIVLGPVLEETFWQAPDISRYWGPDETVETLNISGPFPSYVECVSSHVLKYIHAIETHDSLVFMRDVIPRLHAFIDALANDAAELNRVKLRLAHKDLHYGNILYDNGTITAIIDWEFADVVPFTRWNPTKKMG